MALEEKSPLVVYIHGGAEQDRAGAGPGLHHLHCQRARSPVHSREPSPRAATGPAGASLLHPSPRPPSAAGAGKGLGRGCRGAFTEPAPVRSTGHSGPGGTHRTRALPGGRPLPDTEASSLEPPFRTQILQVEPPSRGLPSRNRVSDGTARTFPDAPAGPSLGATAVPGVAAQVP